MRVILSQIQFFNMSIKLSNVPRWLRRDGSVSIQYALDAMEIEASERGYRLAVTASASAVVEIPIDKRLSIPPPWVAEDFIKDFLLRSLQAHMISQKSTIYSLVLRNTRKIKNQMKNTMPKHDINDSPQQADWIVPDPTGVLLKEDVWEVAKAYGWDQSAKKAFFGLHFPDCPNGKPVRVDGKVGRGWRGGSFNKAAAFKLRLAKMNKLAIKK